jgi:tetratricopeptide (TPR) repeat protein
MFSQKAYGDLVTEISTAKLTRDKKNKSLLLLEAQVQKVSEFVELEIKQQLKLQKKLLGLQTHKKLLKDKLELRTKELEHLHAEDVHKNILFLKQDIQKLHEENNSLKTTIQKMVLSSQHEQPELKSALLEDQVKDFQGKIKRLNLEIEDFSSKCLRLEFQIKEIMEETRRLDQAMENLAFQACEFEENLSCSSILKMNASEILYLLNICRDKHLEACLHWHIAWIGFYNKDVFQAINHFSVAMFCNLDLYKTQKLDYFEKYLKLKELWFDDNAINYSHYLGLKYSSKPVNLEELIFWANRVLSTGSKFDISYEIFSDLFEYYARQNDWSMVDGTYTALSLLSETQPMFLSHLMGIAQATCAYVDSMMTQTDLDYLYLFYLPKMMRSHFYQQHIKSSKKEFWTKEEYKIVAYHTIKDLSPSEQIILSLEGLKLEAPICHEIGHAWIPEIADNPEIPLVLRSWSLLVWAKDLIEKKSLDDARSVLDYALSIYPKFKEAELLKKDTEGGLSVVFFQKDRLAMPLKLSSPEPKR